jgi:hypothetical protein
VGGKHQVALSKFCRLRGCPGLGYTDGANHAVSPVVEVEGFEPSRALLSGRCPASFATPRNTNAAPNRAAFVF